MQNNDVPLFPFVFAESTSPRRFEKKSRPVREEPTSDVYGGIDTM